MAARHRAPGHARQMSVHHDPDRVDRVDPEYSTPFGGRAMGLPSTSYMPHRPPPPPDYRVFGHSQYVEDPAALNLTELGYRVEAAIRGLGREAERQGYVLDLRTFRCMGDRNEFRCRVEGLPR